MFDDNTLEGLLADSDDGTSAVGHGLDFFAPSNLCYRNWTAELIALADAGFRQHCSNNGCHLQQGKAA